MKSGQPTSADPGAARLVVWRAAAASLLVGVVVFSLKLAAWLETGSVALLSDALESILNVVAAAAALVAIWIASRPADARHPFGHAKAEYFSAGLEGALILLAAASIVAKAIERLRAPQALEQLDLGLSLSVLATALNAGLAYGLVRIGRRWHSPALVADGLHVRTDVVTSLAAVAGLGLAAVTGFWLLDPLVALLAALQIVWTGVGAIRQSLSGLMDEALAPELVEEIETAIRDRMGPAIEYHDLRTRYAGPVAFVELHLIVPGDLTVERAHRICDDLELAIRRLLPTSEISIHVEPEAEARAEGSVEGRGGQGGQRGFGGFQVGPD